MPGLGVEWSEEGALLLIHERVHGADRAVILRDSRHSMPWRSGLVQLARSPQSKVHAGPAVRRAKWIHAANVRVLAECGDGTRAGLQAPAVHRERDSVMISSRMQSGAS